MSADDDSGNRGKLFEAFIRTLLCGEKAPFRYRNACGKLPVAEYNKYSTVQLGGCTDIKRSTDITRDSAEMAWMGYSFILTVHRNHLLT
jgi:hypothetical protein